ncbi:hypothetical protein YB51_8680 [Streptococcus suis YB51]|nr:hypothetical protein YB51_8680 [Streptococcus suis YB51]
MSRQDQLLLIRKGFIKFFQDQFIHRIDQKTCKTPVSAIQGFWSEQLDNEHYRISF